MKFSVSVLIICLVITFENANCDIEPVVLVHGGAGDIPNWRDGGKMRGVILAAKVGYKVLKETGNVTDAVEAAVKEMEMDEFFNAGNGAVLNGEKIIEMDASIMDGRNLKVGCVTGITDILHPISVARRVMERTPHNFLSGEGAMRFAKEQNFEILQKGALETFYALESWMEWNKTQHGGPESSGIKAKGEVGTVGAVAIDSKGNIAVATSTGGLTGKMPGRVGDTPVIGSGTYADNKIGGVSSTGHGETIMKVVLTHDILKRMEYLGESVQLACENSCKSMTKRLNETAGVIALDKQGDVGIYFTSQKMAWAYQKSDKVHYGIRPQDDFELTLN